MEDISSAQQAINKGKFDTEVTVCRLQVNALEQAITLLRAKIPGATASDATIRRVQQRNPDSAWGIFRRDDEDRPGAELLGIFLMLPLTTEGARELGEGSLDTSNPMTRHIAAWNERPAAIYYWAIIAEGLTMSAGTMMVVAMGPLYEGVPLYTRPTTIRGLNRTRKLQYEPLIPGRDGLGDVFKMPGYPPLDQLREVLPAWARGKWPAQAVRPRIEVKVAATPAEMEMAMRIRAVYLVEQDCPYEEEYDGNDYCGTTFIGLVDGEPAGTLRVRYFANFVKLERMTVLPRFRGRTLVGREIVKAALALCARKGYRKCYGHAQLHALKFWSRFGFRPMQMNRKLVFSDHEYVEFEGEIPQHDNPITMQGDPYVILRPEGRWDEAGILDYSAGRVATNPH